MEHADVLVRVKLRVDATDSEDALLSDVIQTIEDRLKLRLGVETLPDVFASIVVEATVKSYRKLYYEGISTESAEGISTSFVADVLDEYQLEIDRYIKNQKGVKVKFL